MFIFIIYKITAIQNFFNNKLDINNIEDPFINQDTESSEQLDYKSNNIEYSDSSSTNKELFNDIGKNKLKQKEDISLSENALLTRQKLDEFNEAFNEMLNLDGTVNSLTDKNMWEKLHKYITSHWDKFFIDGHFSITLQLRYVMCSYVIAFIPGQFAFVIPGFYKYLIPKKAYKIPIISDALLGLKRFLKFCKNTSRDKLFVTFYFGRANSLQQDLDFIKNIPDMLVNNPIEIIRELLAFKIKAEGYNS